MANERPGARGEEEVEAEEHGAENTGRMRSA